MEIKKVNNLFICHRPYHVVVSGHIISSILNKGGEKTINDCIIFNVPSFSENMSPGGKYSLGELFRKNNNIKCNHFDHLFNLETIFNNIFKFYRDKEKRIWNIYKFKKFYISFVRDSNRFLDKNYSSLDNVYIFSDKEKQIEILASLIKEKFNAKVYLVDEGIISYYKNIYFFKAFLKRLIVTVFRFKYISNSMQYGGSSIYDIFLTFSDSVQVNKKPLIKSPALNINKYSHVFKEKYPKILNDTTLFITNALSEGNVLSIENDKRFIEKIMKELKTFGFNILVKTHPVEVDGKYEYLRNIANIQIIKNAQLPVELLFSDKNIKFVIGVTSSALLNAKRNNKNVISFVEYLNKNHPIADIYQNYDISLPVNYKELSNLVNKNN